MPSSWQDLHEGAGHRLRVGQCSTRRAAPRCRASRPTGSLLPSERRKYLRMSLKRPARRALFLDPAVVVGRVAAREDLGVDRAAAAQHPGLGIGDLAVVGVLLRRGRQAPGQRAGRHLGEADRHVDQRVGVAPARLQQADAGSRGSRSAARPARIRRCRRPRSHSRSPQPSSPARLVTRSSATACRSRYGQT